MLTDFHLAQAVPPTPPPPPQKEQPGMGSMLMPVAVFLVIMWVVMIRPQQKRQRELVARIAALKTGDRVVTSAGIHGVVTNVKDGATLILKVDDNCKLTIDKSSVVTVLSKEGREDKAKDAKVIA
jgi:preprotein translocase subunit YajC